MPYLLQRARIQGRDTRRKESQLVKEDDWNANYRYNCRYAYQNP